MFTFDQNVHFRSKRLIPIKCDQMLSKRSLCFFDLISGFSIAVAITNWPITKCEAFMNAIEN